MANLTSTAPAAFAQAFNLIQAAGASQSPAVDVFNIELLQFEPNTYVVLTGIENHRWDWAALGSYAFYEYYDIVGYCTIWLGDVDPATVMSETYGLYESVVQTTIVANRAPPLSANLQSAGLLEILPGYARYTGEQGVNDEGGPMGFFGKVEFSYSCKARVTV